MTRQRYTHPRLWFFTLHFFLVYCRRHFRRKRIWDILFSHFHDDESNISDVCRWVPFTCRGVRMFFYDSNWINGSEVRCYYARTYIKDACIFYGNQWMWKKKHWREILVKNNRGFDWWTLSCISCPLSSPPRLKGSIDKNEIQPPTSSSRNRINALALHPRA